MVGGDLKMSEKPTKVRYIVLFIVCLVYLITYLDRVAISVAAPLMMKDFGINKLEWGLVLSVFSWTYSDIITDNSLMTKTINLAQEFSGVDSNVLILGDTGVGKEVFAQSIHNASKRQYGPFVAVNCAALPENLLESELFGYVDGAFTGASRTGKMGLFEQAHQGTIFLDEVGEISPNIQARLLRVLQEREVMRIGDDRVIPVDVRVMAATNRNLKKAMQDCGFRPDLFYRLNVLNLEIPPLRHRPEDILKLLNCFMANYAQRFQRPTKKLTQAACEIMRQRRGDYYSASYHRSAC